MWRQQHEAQDRGEDEGEEEGCAQEEINLFVH